MTSQSWEFWSQQPGTVAPHVWDNPYGAPTPFRPVNASPGFVSDGPGYTGVNTWHVDVDGGGFFVDIPNDPQNRPLKQIQIQWTSDKPPLAPPVSNPPGTAAQGGTAPFPNGWNTYEWYITISPNPPFETIFVPFPASTDIGEVDVKTICYTPEPGTLGLMALAGLLLRRRRQ